MIGQQATPSCKHFSEGKKDKQFVAVSIGSNAIIKILFLFSGSGNCDVITGRHNYRSH